MQLNGKTLQVLKISLISEYDYDCDGCGYAPAGVQIHMNDKHKVPRPGASGDA